MGTAQNFIDITRDGVITKTRAKLTQMDVLTDEILSVLNTNAAYGDLATNPALLQATAVQVAAILVSG